MANRRDFISENGDGRIEGLDAAAARRKALALSLTSPPSADAPQPFGRSGGVAHGTFGSDHNTLATSEARRRLQESHTSIPRVQSSSGVEAERNGNLFVKKNDDIAGSLRVSADAVERRAVHTEILAAGSQLALQTTSMRSRIEALELQNRILKREAEAADERRLALEAASTEERLDFERAVTLEIPRLLSQWRQLQADAEDRKIELRVLKEKRTAVEVLERVLRSERPAAVLREVLLQWRFLKPLVDPDPEIVPPKIASKKGDDATSLPSSPRSHLSPIDEASAREAAKARLERRKKGGRSASHSPEVLDVPPVAADVSPVARKATLRQRANLKANANVAFRRSSRAPSPQPGT
eukprot:TRINITY_DN49196_c0_g1_i1.p1 TRINITY_DN49196_c0_g1~~TRINITY_DN49196_c0_g1_i1.p1  ORF type:complete len:355 (-),score=55.68 TRINITY_DN49196_c0_g1_i1:88-1152(-)